MITFVTDNKKNNYFKNNEVGKVDNCYDKAGTVDDNSGNEKTELKMPSKKIRKIWKNSNQEKFQQTLSKILKGQKAKISLLKTRNNFENRNTEIDEWEMIIIELVFLCFSLRKD